MLSATENVIRVDFPARVRGRRRFLRENCFITVRLAFPGCGQRQLAILEEISDGGARLRVTNSVTLPEIFDLYGFSESGPVRCRKIWGEAGRAGIEFISDGK